MHVRNPCQRSESQAEKYPLAALYEPQVKTVPGVLDMLASWLTCFAHVSQAFEPQVLKQPIPIWSEKAGSVLPF